MLPVAKILMFVENYYPRDPRVRNEAEKLTKAGYGVTVLALRVNGEKSRETVRGVTVYRIPEITLFSKSLKDNPSFLDKAFYRLKSVIGYVFEYFYFTFACWVLSLNILFREGFDAIHCHNPPDTLFVIGVFYKLFGKKFVFDHHDLSPELYRSRFSLNEGLIVKALLFVEKCNLKFADIVIATNESYRDIEVERGKINPGKVYIVRNGPDMARFRQVPPDADLKKKEKIILGYLGFMGPQDGVDYMLRAIQFLVYKIGRKDFYCVVIGHGDSLEDLKNMSRDLGLEEYVWFTGFISEEDKIRYLCSMDICLDPNPSNPLNDVSTWIKVMEYMALGKPTVSFNLKETRFTAREAAIYVQPNDVEEYAQAILKLMDDEKLRGELGAIGKKRVEEVLNWSIVSKNLVKAYDNLFNRNPMSA